MRFFEPRLESEDEFGRFLIVDMSSSTVDEFNSFPKFTTIGDTKYQRTGWDEGGYLCYRALPFPSPNFIKQNPHEFQCPTVDE